MKKPFVFKRFFQSAPRLRIGKIRGFSHEEYGRQEGPGLPGGSESPAVALPGLPPLPLLSRRRFLRRQVPPRFIFSLRLGFSLSNLPLPHPRARLSS